MFFFFPLYFLEIGLNGFQSGVLLGIITLTGIVFSFHVGIKTDSVKQKYFLAFGIVLFSLFSIGLVFTKDFYFLLPLFFILGLAKIIIRRSTDTLVMKSSQKHGKEMARFQIIKILPLIIGIILGGYLIHIFGYSFIFMLSAILFVPIIFVAFSIKDTGVFSFPVTRYMDDLKNKKVILFSIIVFIFSLHFGAEQTAYSPYIKQVLGLSLVQSSYFIAGVAIFLIVSAYFTGKAIDRGVSKIKLISYSMFVSGLGSILFAITRNPILSFLARGLHDIGDGAFLVTMSVGIISLFDKKRLGGNAGFINLTVIFATFLGSVVFGHIGYTYGYHMPHIISGTLSILAFVMVFIFRKRY